ncbi:hypothetical protein KIN20_006415 [Parelaphostrongylus tenuis]|uniref:Uncharacterized protein n=1 Tax=Parelaphostrongylus tenuis TaxID=148309 RepID=A0AAD5QL00_PARTN|nr:hypothetical protein KIN20_006415 [Parelaphostrongylus tenuis]
MKADNPNNTIVTTGVVLFLLFIAFVLNKVKKYGSKKLFCTHSHVGYPYPPPSQSPIPDQPYPMIHFPFHANSANVPDTVVTVDGTLLPYDYYASVSKQITAPPSPYEPPPPYPGVTDKTPPPYS